MPWGHVHIGIWLYTLQIAFVPHVPLHGSSHLFLMHALFIGQSVFKIHSGRHPEYGSPWYSLIHVHLPLLHNAFGPHGDGLHGSEYCGSWATIKLIINDN